MKNPLFIGADPFILAYEGKYYIYPTTYNLPEDSEEYKKTEGYKVFESSDLVNWECKGYALDSKDVKGDKWFWAPEITVRDGKLYMVYTSEEHIGIAVADNPLGPFKQEEKKWLSERSAIDGHFFVDDDGQTYLYYVRFDHGNKICVAKMSDDLMSIDESTETLLISAEDPWETVDCLVTEGPFVLKHNGLYYLTYSANHTRNHAYAVGYAVSDNPFGPFKKYEGNPVLHSSETVVGVGHHSFATLSDGRILCAYHSHNSPEQFQPRVVRLDWAEFKPNPNGGEDIFAINGPTED